MTTVALLPAVLLDGAPTTPRTCDVVARATGLDVELRITQTVGNTTARPAELVVHVPVTATGAVRHVEATIGGTTIVATLEDKHQARAAYHMAVAANRTAALAEDLGGDVVVLSFGNVPAGDVASCTVVLDDALAIEAIGARLVARLMLPTSIGDRYGAVSGPTTAQVGLRTWFSGLPTASRSSLQPGPVALDIERSTTVASGAAVTFEFDLDVDHTLPAVARLTPDAPLGRPRLPGDDRFAHDATVAVPVVTGREVVGGPVELVVVVDRSGSMEGWQQTLANDLAARLVERLGDADRVAAFVFDDQIDELRGSDDARAALASLPAGHGRRHELARLLRATTARGGTELAAALTHVVNAIGPAATRRVTVLLTDGQVGDDRGVMAAAGHLGDLHVVAIGQGAHESLLATLGHAIRVESPQRLADVAEQLEAVVRAPVFTDVRVTVPGRDGVLPAAVSNPLVAGTCATVYARVPATTDAVQVELHRADGTMVRQLLAVQRQEPALTLRARYARLAIRGAERRVALGLIGREELVQLSLAASVLCSETAFVAIGRELTRAEREPGRVFAPAGARLAAMPSMVSAAARPLSARRRTAMVLQNEDAAAYGGAAPAPLAAPSPLAESAALLPVWRDRLTKIVDRVAAELAAGRGGLDPALVDELDRLVTALDPASALHVAVVALVRALRQGAAAATALGLVAAVRREFASLV